MSNNTSKALIDLIDSRIATKRYQRVAVVESVSEDGKTATVSFPGTDMVVNVNIKTPEKFEAGDSVTIASVDGDLMNGYIQTRFGESSWLSVGDGIEVEPGAIDEDALAPGSVTGGKIADFSVTNAHIVNATITNAKIQNAAITNAKIANATITTAKIQDAAITNAKIENAAIDNAKIGIAAIDTANIKNAAITTACIGDAAIMTTQIADGSVTDAKIVGLTANKITAGTIDAGTITVVNLDAANITVGRINGVQIEDGAIGIAKLDAIVNDKIATAQATADGKNTIFYHGEEPVLDNVKKDDTWFDIGNGYKMYTYDGTAWIAAPFGTDAIDDSAVTGTKLANGTITGVKMIDGAITAREIATGAIVADKLAANSVTANSIESKSIKALHIDTNTITSDKLLLGDNTNFSTVWLSQYITDDWIDWTGMTFPAAIKDANDYVYPSLTSNTDFLFSMPFDATALTTVTAENSFGFKFTTKNSATTNKTALLSVYFFDLDKKYLNKATLETFIINGITDDGIDNEIQDWDFIKTVTKNAGAKYFTFGINITGGFTGMFKNIQIRRSVGSTFISDGSITTTKIVTDAITSDKIAARSILANKIATNAITAGEIAAGTITADEIAANAVTAMKIKAGEVTTDHIAPNFGETLDITANSAITDIDGRLTSAELKVAPDAITATVTSSVAFADKLADKADLDDLNALDARLDSAELKITPSAITATVTSSSDYVNDLAEKASTSELNSLNTRVSTTETKITPTAITSTVRSSTEYTTDLGSKLSTSNYTGNEIVSRINQTATTFSIDAAKVNITGFVTFSTAQSLANTAESNATSNASTYAANARTNAVSDVKTGLGNSNYTTIHGGNISTRTISADRIATGSITANEIAAGTITANKISLTGLLNGYSSGKATGFSISSEGLIQLPVGASLRFGSDVTGIYRMDSTHTLQMFNQIGDIHLSPTGSTRIYNLNATNEPYNIPRTSPITSNKINMIQWKSTYVEVTLGSGAAKGIDVWDSDVRLKSNIFYTNIDALSKVSKIKVRSFNWVEDGKFEDCGFIAQEIEKDLGEKHVLKIPQNNGDVRYQISEKGFIPLLTKSIQELNSQLTATKNEVSILKAKTDSYEQILHEMRLEIENLKNGMVA